MASGRDATPPPALPKVACIVTEYRPRSHADVIVSKLLGGLTEPQARDRDRYDLGLAARELSELPLPLDARGRLRRPRVRVASLYTDQVPAHDVSREWAARTGVPIYPTIREALTLGGDRLAVDGVILIGEHGDYPENERGQQLYPRRRFFEETVAVFRHSGRSVPIFNDKHLGFAWDDARWMVETARAMDFPLLAGSSLSVTPVSWRKPPLDFPLGVGVADALVAGYGPVERYGFHALEILQCLVERRGAGETGVAAVQCLTGEAVWQAQAAGRWDEALLLAALTAVERRTAGTSADVRALVPEPVAFLLDYRDGLTATVLLLNGALTGHGFAARLVTPQPAIVATEFAGHSQEPFGHFAHLVEHIQDLICHRQAPYPVERTLLTTGILDRLMESRWRGGVRLDSPELAVAYCPPR